MVVLMLSRCSFPATGQMGLASAPTVHPPVCFSTMKSARGPLLCAEEILHRIAETTLPTVLLMLLDLVIVELAAKVVGLVAQCRWLPVENVIGESGVTRDVTVADFVLANDREDRADDDIPVLADRDLDDRLDVQLELTALVCRPLFVGPM